MTPLAEQRPRLLRIPLHLLIVALVLGLAHVSIGPHYSYFSDEGAAALQALALDDGSWFHQYPLAELDPEQEARPFLRGDVGTKGVAPYAKHPLYPVLLQGAHTLLGRAGFTMLSVLGTVVAAGAAALIARRRGAGTAVLALWLTAVGTPLFFDSFLIVAHTLAAAAVAIGVWGVLRTCTAPEGRDWPDRVVPLIACGGGVAVSTAVRTEALLWWAALVAMLLVLALRRSITLVAATVASGVVLTAGVSAWLVEQWVTRAITGSPIESVAGVSATWSERIGAAQTTLFRPSVDAFSHGDVLLVAGAAFVACAGIAVRRRRPDLASVMVWAALGAYLVGWALRPTATIPGLFVAFPLLGFVLVVGWHPRRERSVATVLLLGSCLVFGAAVLLTQYSQGGGVEWGWRYFSLATPLVSVLCAQVLVDAVRRDLTVGWPVMAPVVVITLVTAAMGLQELARGHADGRWLAARIEAAAATLHPPGGGDDRPLVFVQGQLVPQILWPDFDEYTWVAVAERHISRYSRRLADHGYESMVFVSSHPQNDAARLVGWRVLFDGELPEGGIVVATAVRVDGP
ncbi:MAG: hypothetical protein JJE52_05870 [Acidimicrobiia bacterium]|nr:hypothetical protein [Acidimicrobiia bacterium]